MSFLLLCLFRRLLRQNFMDAAHGIDDDGAEDDDLALGGGGATFAEIPSGISTFAWVPGGIPSFTGISRCIPANCHAALLASKDVPNPLVIKSAAWAVEPFEEGTVESTCCVMVTLPFSNLILYSMFTMDTPIWVSETLTTG
jgi:hypothetical protein